MRYYFFLVTPGPSFPGGIEGTQAAKSAEEALRKVKASVRRRADWSHVFAIGVWASDVGYRAGRQPLVAWLTRGVWARSY